MYVSKLIPPDPAIVIYRVPNSIDNSMPVDHAVVTITFLRLS